MIHPRNQLQSLWDMLRFYADKFLFGMTALNGLRAMLNSYRSGTKGTVQLSQTEEMGDALRHLVEIFVEMEMPVSLANAQGLLEIYEKEQERTLQDISKLVTLLYNSTITEFKGRLFVAVGPSTAEYFESRDPLFGTDVESKFPQMSEDISEAGTCLSLNRSTATIFHLMRVMELGVQAFGTKLGVTLAAEQNWQIILDQINTAIRALDQKDPQTKAYAGASSHLYNVKLAWRNEVMHPKQTYTLEEARNVFNAVQVFIKDLALLV